MAYLSDAADVSELAFVVISAPNGEPAPTIAITDLGFFLGSLGSTSDITLADDNTDGHVDVVTNLNVFTMSSRIPLPSKRFVASGNGDGTFRCLPGQLMYCAPNARNCPPTGGSTVGPVVDYIEVRECQGTTFGACGCPVGYSGSVPCGCPP
jgi:hypothetical protein